MKAPQPACYAIVTPKKNRIPLVVDSPHSGSVLPEDFHFSCSVADLRQSEDSYVDQFARNLPNLGGTVIRALVNRAYIDLNRSVGDLHPGICSEPIPWPTNKSKRVQYGIGLIRHLIRPHEPVYAEPLSLAEIQHRITHYYEPYYAVLEHELIAAQKQFGRVLHLNLHSTPNIGADGAPHPDIILGDHDGHSCGRTYREMIKRVFEDHGLKVLVNNPYKGVELTRRFAKPRQGFHSLQIEVNKALYMDEQTLAFNDGMTEMMAVFNDLWAQLADMFKSTALPQAAE